MVNIKYFFQSTLIIKLTLIFETTLNNIDHVNIIYYEHTEQK